jgi:tRNA A37 threonylcarbamoyladenosine dehydratase
MAPPLVLPVDGPVPEDQAGIADLPIGMDDPTLASKIQAKGFAAPGEPAPMIYSSEPEEEPEPDVEAEPTRKQKKKQIKEKKPARVRDTRPGFGAFMVVTCLPTAMAAGAWQLSTMFAEDPVIWTTPAGVLGLLFSWLWVRWKYRER